MNKPKPKYIPICDLDEVVGPIGAWIEEAAVRLVQIKQQEGELEAEGDKLRKALLEVYQSEEVQGVTVENWVIRLKAGRSASRIDAGLLAEHSVPASVISACTMQGTEYTTIEVRQLARLSDGAVVPWIP